MVSRTRSLTSNTRDVVDVSILLLLPAAHAVRSEPVLLAILPTGQRPGNASVFGNLFALACHPGKIRTDRDHDCGAVGRWSVQYGKLRRREPLGAIVRAERDEHDDDEREA